jgi:hypothetical protein
MLGSKLKERESPESALKSTHPFHPRPLQNIRVRGDHVRGSDHVTNFVNCITLCICIIISLKPEFP